jgi:DNA-binding XRE family transcriptional regulator
VHPLQHDADIDGLYRQKPGGLSFVGDPPRYTAGRVVLRRLLRKTQRDAAALVEQSKPAGIPVDEHLPQVLTDELSPGQSLLQLRVAAGLKQDRLAARVGLTRTNYSSLERGEVASLSGEDAERLAEGLGVDADAVRTAHTVARAAFLENLA